MRPTQRCWQLLAEPLQRSVRAHRTRTPLPGPVVVCSSALADRAPWHRCHRAACAISPEMTPHVPTSPSTSLGRSACHRAGRLPAARANTQRLWTLPRGMAPAHQDGSRPLGSRPVSRPSQACPLHTAAFGAARLRRPLHRCRRSTVPFPCARGMSRRALTVPRAPASQEVAPLTCVRRWSLTEPPRLRRLEGPSSSRCRDPTKAPRRGSRHTARWCADRCSVG
jgi:hypothetical protein